MFNRITKRLFCQYDVNTSTFLRLPLKFVSVLIVKYLQKRYKSISIKNRYNQSNQVLSKLKLIQAILYYFKSQFSACGYFHPSCVWSEKDEIYFRKLFPQKEDFEELDSEFYEIKDLDTVMIKYIKAHAKEFVFSGDVKILKF